MDRRNNQDNILTERRPTNCGHRGHLHHKERQMKQRMDSIVKQAKRTGSKVSQRLKQEDAPMLAKVCALRQEEKESSRIRVWGPYQEGAAKFRLKVSEGSVERNLTFRTREEAEAVKDDLLRKLSRVKQITIADALEEWSQHLMEVRGLKPKSARWVVQVSRFWLPLDKPLAQITAPDAKQLYSEHVSRPCPRTKKPPSAATHHEQLLLVRRFWDWGIEQGYCRDNPWKSVRKIGRKPKGKPQLRIDEARRLEAVAMERAKAGDAAALGVLLMIYLGLRQGEVAVRVARDVDDEGRVLWIPSGKTINARRRLKVPEHLQPLVVALARPQRPDGLIFYPEDIVFHHSYYVNYVRRLCRTAGVPEVVPHSLRGLHATLALDGGATADAVAKALGHGSFAITRQHYASPSSVDNARSGRVAAALGVRPPTKELAALLSSLSQEQLAELFSALPTRPLHAPHPEENSPD